jgi:hypothetical protein
MKTPRELSREELEGLADVVQHALYLTYSPAEGTFYWDPAKEWEAADVLQGLARCLEDFSLVPEAYLPYQAGQ